MKFQLNGIWIDTLKKYEVVKHEIFINHSKNIKTSYWGMKAGVFSIDCIHYFIEKRKKEDLISFLKTVKPDLSYKDILHLFISIEDDSKKRVFLILLKDFIFESKSRNSTNNIELLNEEETRHTLIFKLIDLISHDEILSKWNDLQTLITSNKKFSFKSMLLWEMLVPEKHKDFFNYLLNSKYSYLVAQSSKKENSIAQNPEDIVFLNISFDNKLIVEECFSNINILKKNNIMDENSRYNVGTIINENKHLDTENIFFFKEKYNEIYKGRENFNTVNCLSALMMKNGEFLDKLNNNYFKICVEELEKEFKDPDGVYSRHFKTWATGLLEMWLENIENKESLVIIDDYINKYELSKKEVYQGSFANVNMHFKQDKETLDFIFKEIRKYKKELSYVLLPSKYLGYSKNRESGIAKENIQHYLPFYLEELRKNKDSLHNEDSLEIRKRFENRKMDEFTDCIKEVIVNSKIPFKYLQKIYTEDDFHKLPFMSEVLSLKEKIEIGKNIINLSTENYKKRM